MAETESAVAVPTMDLRFVEREIEAPPRSNVQFMQVRILQQKWTIHPKEGGNIPRYPPLRIEWRDVPCVQEGDDEDDG